MSCPPGFDIDIDMAAGPEGIGAPNSDALTEAADAAEVDDTAASAGAPCLCCQVSLKCVDLRYMSHRMVSRHPFGNAARGADGRPADAGAVKPRRWKVSGVRVGGAAVARDSLRSVMPCATTTAPVGATSSRRASSPGYSERPAAAPLKASGNAGGSRKQAAVAAEAVALEKVLAAAAYGPPAPGRPSNQVFSHCLNLTPCRFRLPAVSSCACKLCEVAQLTR